MKTFDVHLIKENVADVCGSGLVKEFSGKALQELAETLPTVPVYNTPQTFGQTNYNVIGKVTDAEYVESEGLYCEITITDDEIARQLSEDTLTLVPDISHEEITSKEAQSTHLIESVTIENIRPAVTSTEHVGDVTSV